MTTAQVTSEPPLNEATMAASDSSVSAPPSPGTSFSLLEMSSSASSIESTSGGVHIGAALVIGGCGFLGHHVVKTLLKEPTCTSVAVMSRSPFKNRFEGVTYHIGDITKAEHVDHVVSQVKPRIVINTASPHAYIDHEHAYAYFTVNVDGNKNLLAAMADVGTVRAYVYTSSGPIIASPGGGYDHATEDHPTLAWPVVKKGDPYHLAKALGDKMVLAANRKNGIRTACIRPTALYGEGDFQMIEPVIRVLDEQQTNVWLGYNDIDMDVVYVGHVAEAEVLAVKGLLRGIDDRTAPKVDGEAFNITDDAPCYPWTFFRKYWVFAGDKTPLSAIWYIHPAVVMFFSHFAEWWAWSFSLGKKRPSRLKVERMEFALFTRTYSIQKIRDRLGFKPWVNQPYASQDEAVKGSLDWWLLPENHGPVKVHGLSPWPESPFRLISNTGAKTKAGLPQDHYCIRNAQIMAMTHNTIFRALNAIYHQAPLIAPGTQEAVDFMAYCLVTFEFIHHHQLSEELLYFPEIEKAAGIPGLMETNVEQHHEMDAGLEKFRKYVESTPKDSFSGEKIRGIIDKFAPIFEAHNHAEIGTILELHDKVDSVTLKKIDEGMRDDAEKNSDMFKVAPFVLGCQDKNFILDDEIARFPLQPYLVLLFVRVVLAGRHAGLWRFNPSNLHGNPRELPKPKSTKTSSAVSSSIWKGMIPYLVLLISLLSAVLFMM